MALTPQFKIFSPSNEYMGSAKYQEDAANWASTLGPGATIRHGHAKKDIMYTIPESGDIDFMFTEPRA